MPLTIYNLTVRNRGRLFKILVHSKICPGFLLYFCGAISLDLVGNLTLGVLKSRGGTCLEISADKMVGVSMFL